MFVIREGLFAHPV